MWGYKLFENASHLDMLSKREEKEVLRKIGERVRELRIEKGLSQFELNVDSELSKNQIGRVERGEHNVSIITLIKIAKALQVEISEIIKF